MKTSGIALLCGGVFLALLSLLMSTSVGDIHNLAKAQAQTLAFSGGCVLFLGGAVFLAAGVLDESLRGVSRALRSQRTTAPGPARDAVIEEDDVLPSGSVPSYTLTPVTAEEQKSANRLYWGLLVVLGLFAMIVLVLTFAIEPKPPAAPAAANLYSPNDGLEYMPDNMEALSDTTDLGR